MPEPVVATFWRLHETLVQHGPTGPRAWRNYGKLKGRTEKFHCHLTSNHQWIAVWRAEQSVLTIEILYVGSHQGAPY